MIRYSGIVFVACFGMVFTAYGTKYSYGILLPQMLPALMISKAEAGVIFSAYFVAYAGFSPIVGFLADRISARALLGLSAALLGIGSFSMAFSSSVIEASFGFGLVGIGASGCWSPVVALSQRLASERRRGRVIALIDMGAPLGGIVSSMAMPIIVVESGWRMGWKGLGTLALVIGCIVFFLLKSSFINTSDLRNPKRRWRFYYTAKALYGEILKNTGFWLIGLSYLLIAFSAVIPLTFISAYAVEELSLSYKRATSLVTIIAAASMTGKLVLGYASDFLGRRRLMMLCGVMISAGVLGIGYWKSFNVVCLCTLIFGFGQGAAHPLYATYAADYFPKNATGSIIGAWTFFLCIGSILAPIIAGWIADTTRTITSSFILAAITGMLSCFLLLPLQKKDSWCLRNCVE